MKKILSLVAALLFVTFVNAQSDSQKAIEGCWEIIKGERTDGTPVDLEEMNGPGKLITCFGADGKFLSKIDQGGKESTLGTGSYKISEDGKTIEQSMDMPDGGDSMEVPSMEIVTLNAKSLVIKGDGIVMRLQKQ